MRSRIGFELQAAALAVAIFLAAPAARAVEFFYAGTLDRPWKSITSPSNATTHACLCGYVYNGSAVGWQFHDRVPAATTCNAKCPAPSNDALAFPTPATYRWENWKKCATYDLIHGRGWSAAAVVDHEICHGWFDGKTVEMWKMGFDKVPGNMVRNIHFFNWGTGADPAVITRDPNALEAAIRGNNWKINYWYEKVEGTRLVPRTHIPRLSARQLTIGPTVASPGKLLEGTTLASRGTELDNLIKALVAHGQYAPIKDIVMLAILYKEGGYMLDNTFDILNDNMTSAAGQVNAALLAGMRGGMKCPIYVTNPGSGIGNQPFSGGYANITSVDDIFYELNIMYHPKGNSTTINSLKCMLDAWHEKNLPPAPAHALSLHEKAELKSWAGIQHTGCTTTWMRECIHRNTISPHLTAWLGRKPSMQETATWRGPSAAPSAMAFPTPTAATAPAASTSAPI